MVKNRRTTQDKEVQDYRHDTATRKNNPPAGIAAQGKIQETRKQEYAYNPHLPPTLRSDPDGDADILPELLQIAQQRKLTADEAKTLADALRHHEPWLEWSGKQETKAFTVDPVALHIHERVSAKAILKVAERQNVQRDLFADPQQTYGEAVDFYQHDVEWANRLILGDSLTVMSSLAHREALAGKVQMIYMDPPYGIKFASNFQPTVFQRDVKDRAQDLTRDPEQIKAYRDTWTLGVHSYLAYLRDRLIVAKELLTDSGSIFVQMSDENVHRVRCIMDEVFGSENFVASITYKVTSGTQQKMGPRRISDFILWYARDRDRGKFRRLYQAKALGEGSTFKSIELADYTRRSMTKAERENPTRLPESSRAFRSLPLHSQGSGDNQSRQFEGKTWGIPDSRHWTHSSEGFERLVSAGRIHAGSSALRAIYYFTDTPIAEITTTWNDTAPETDKNYVVQTSMLPIQRCLLMTTDPGDLVLDPTCVRKGTKVLQPASIPSQASPFNSHESNPPNPPQAGGNQSVDGGLRFLQSSSVSCHTESDKFPKDQFPLACGGVRGGNVPFTPIGNLHPGDQFPCACCVESVDGGLRFLQSSSVSCHTESDKSSKDQFPLACGGVRGGNVPFTPIGNLHPGDQFPCACCVESVDGGLRFLQSSSVSCHTESDKSSKDQFPLACGGGLGGGSITLTAIENLRPGDWVLSDTGKPRRVLRTLRKRYRGQLIGIRHKQSRARLWVTADHYVLCKQRTLSYETDQAWGKIPKEHFGRARELRKQMTAAEKKLWHYLRNTQLGVKFRKQHPIGPYITDFYTRDVGLIIEVDGDTHLTAEAKVYDNVRTDYLRQLGLTVLRFTNLEVFDQLDFVMDRIYQALQTVRPSKKPFQQWRRADTLQVRDVVYFDVHCEPIEIDSIQHIDTDEDVYDLEVDTDHSYLTEVCAVHNCGSGTTAHVAEQWGRRWIIIDTSRVAVALARQRLLTSTFDYYTFKHPDTGVAGGFRNKTVPHITLKSIAQNTALDPIFAKHEPILKEKLDVLNKHLTQITPPGNFRATLLSKLSEKERREGKRSITEADRRRWQLPESAWQEWEVPFDTDPDWPQPLQDALTDYRSAWREKMDEVNACIAASSESEELVDQPEVDRKRIRVSGPFTVEAVQPPEESLAIDSPIGGEPEEPLDTYEPETEGQAAINAAAYLDQMIRLLRNDGVRFPNNQTLTFASLDSLEGDVLHAEGTWENDDTERRVTVVFGPQHGPVTAMQVEQCLRAAYRFGYDDLVFAGFSFDGAAQAAIQDDLNPNVRIHMAHINPDVAMGGLLKETPTSQLFTVFGLPRTELKETGTGEYLVKMEGVDIYNPVDNTVSSAGADKVAAWFVDSDYDGRTFCITQAFFPDKTAWNKIARALKGVIDVESFEKFSGTESFPFSTGTHACVAVKVIDPRGNEVMQVHNLRESTY